MAPSGFRFEYFGDGKSLVDDQIFLIPLVFFTVSCPFCDVNYDSV